MDAHGPSRYTALFNSVLDLSSKYASVTDLVKSLVLDVSEKNATRARKLILSEKGKQSLNRHFCELGNRFVCDDALCRGSICGVTTARIQGKLCTVFLVLLQASSSPPPLPRLEKSWWGVLTCMHTSWRHDVGDNRKLAIVHDADQLLLLRVQIQDGIQMGGRGSRDGEQTVNGGGGCDCKTKQPQQQLRRRVARHQIVPIEDHQWFCSLKGVDATGFGLLIRDAEAHFWCCQNVECGVELVAAAGGGCKRCTKCKEVYYCSKRCRERDHERHALVCTGAVENQCARCQQPFAQDAHRRKCFVCKRVQYCSKACRTAHLAIHRLDCKV